MGGTGQTNSSGLQGSVNPGGAMQPAGGSVMQNAGGSYGNGLSSLFSGVNQPAPNGYGGTPASAYPMNLAPGSQLATGFGGQLIGGPGNTNQTTPPTSTGGGTSPSGGSPNPNTSLIGGAVGTPYWQQQYQQNPQGVQNMFSPPAYNQLSQFYPGLQGNGGPQAAGSNPLASMFSSGQLGGKGGMSL